MNENEVKNAFDHIEPEPGAQERMYANILKKAAARREYRRKAAYSSKTQDYPDVAALGELSRLPCHCDCRRICTSSFSRPIRAG